MRKLVIEYDETESIRNYEKEYAKVLAEQKRDRKLAKAEMLGESAYDKAMDEIVAELSILDFFENDELAEANKDKSFTTLEKANIVAHSTFNDEIKNAYLKKLMLDANDEEKKLIEGYIKAILNNTLNELGKNPFKCIVELNVPYKPFDYLEIKDITSSRCVVADSNDPLVKRVKEDSSLSHYPSEAIDSSWVKLGIANYFIEDTDFSHTGRKNGNINASYRHQYYSFKLKDIKRVSILDMTVGEILMIEEIKKQAKEHAENEKWELNC